MHHRVRRHIGYASAFMELVTAPVALSSPLAKAWSKSDLLDLISAKMKDVRLIAVLNREPYIHRHTENGLACTATRQRSGYGA